MAQQVKLMGAIYSDVPAILLPDNNNVMHRFDDASVTTATASDVASGKVFLASDGTITTGTSSGGGDSAWTKIAETSYQVSTTQTSAATVATWATGSGELWTSAKWVYVRVRDTAGKRAGYFYGSDHFFYNPAPANNTSGSSFTTAIRITIRYETSGYYAVSSSAYGVYPDNVHNDGRVRIRAKYNSTNSHTINGTYKVEVYLLNSPDGVPIFE